MRLALLLVCVLVACLGASTASNASDIAKALREWVDRNVNCDDTLQCNVNVNRTGRRKRDADDVTTPASDDDGDDDQSNNSDDSAFLDEACSGLGLKSDSSFSLNLVTETFRVIDKAGTADDVLAGTEPSKFVKALELLESCLLKLNETG